MFDLVFVLKQIYFHHLIIGVVHCYRTKSSKSIVTVCYYSLRD